LTRKLNNTDGGGTTVLRQGGERKGMREIKLATNRGSVTLYKHALPYWNGNGGGIDNDQRMATSLKKSIARGKVRKTHPEGGKIRVNVRH